jgi:methionyl-tRNA formyltransferase/peptidoglycan/xylan/chitin deacetylase (PgdA/CDA1 family)
MSRNIAVFTGNLNYSVIKGIVEIDKSLTDAAWLVLVQRSERTWGRLLKNQWRNLRRNGWRWIVYQAGDIRTRALASCEAATGRRELTPQALRLRPNMHVLEVAELHAPSSIATLKAFAPDLGLSLAAPILRPALFTLPRLGTLNLHKGKLPEYRGMPPAFWELWNDEDHVGCSVHWVDERLDTGRVVREARVQRECHSTLRGLQLQLDETGVGLMRDAVGDALAGGAAGREQGPQGRTFRKPTLAQQATLDRRMRETQPARFLKTRIVKSMLPGLGFHLWRWSRLRLAAPRITVLLYHRVTDSVRDNLTVGIEQFDRQMGLLARHCRVLSLDEVLATQRVPSSDEPLVAVTFDDGYLDNYEHGVPTLMRHGIPAAFFVSTGIVGTSARFPHDVVRGNPPIPTMTWPQLREMRAAGFMVGSHTVNHIDCAASPQEVVWHELTASRDDLQRELGVTAPVLAYPYGGRQHMTPERLELVKRSGYVGCLSAYGGANVHSVDRYNVVRRGIHWEFTDQAFLFACLGLR